MMTADYGNVKKHPSQYRTLKIKELLKTLVTELKPKNQIVSEEKLLKLIEGEHLFKVIPCGGFWNYPVYVVNKKKLRKAVKRLMSKCFYKYGKVHKKLIQSTSPFIWNDEIGDYVRNDGGVQNDDEIAVIVTDVKQVNN